MRRDFAVAAWSVHRRVELLRGRPLGLTVVVVPESAPAADVRSLLATGAPTVPDGAAAVLWTEVRDWGLRTAAALQSR
jgi:hypothetical protein